MKALTIVLTVVAVCLFGYSTAFSQDGWDDTGDQVILESIGDKVGIGTPAPAEKLTVGNGAILLMEKWDPQPWRELLIKNRAVAYSDDRPAILTGSGSAVKNSAFDYYGSLILAGRDIGNGGIYFLTGDGSGHQERMVIKPDGRIGIGSSNPQQNLSIADVRPSLSLVENGGDAGVMEFNEVTNQIRFQYRTQSGSVWEKNIMVLDGDDGNVGIGTININEGYKLSVGGSIRAEEIVVETGWADFVFEDDYELKPLSDLESFIRENKHLPEIPSAGEVEDNGVKLGDMQSKLLQKIEELTLYVIEQDKALKAIEKEHSEMKTKYEALVNSAN